MSDEKKLRLVFKGDAEERPEPTYEPLNVCCGVAPDDQAWPKGAKRIYTLKDVDRWAKGDLTDCDSPPREVIANLATLVAGFIRGQIAPLPVLTHEEWKARHPNEPLEYKVAVGVSVWVRLEDEK